MAASRSSLMGAVRKGYGDAATAIAAFRRSAVDYRPGATVFDVSSELRISWLERDPGAGGGVRHHIRESAPKRLILATGAQERPMPFPGWTLPGVMGVGALQTALKTGGLLPTPGTLVLAGQGPLLLLYFSQIVALGGRVAAILDLTPPGRLRAAIGRTPRALVGDPRLMARGVGLLMRRACRGHRSTARSPGWRPAEPAAWSASASKAGAGSVNSPARCWASMTA